MIEFFRYRIGPFEVENALIEHSAVAESAVVSSPDPIRGEVMYWKQNASTTSFVWICYFIWIFFNLTGLQCKRKRLHVCNGYSVL